MRYADPVWPRRLISAVVGAWARSALSRPLIGPFIRRYGVDLADVDRPAGEYPNLAALFGRTLAPGRRPLDADPQAFLCPCDGVLVRHGPIADQTLVQAKGIEYRVADLVPDGIAAGEFANGHYATLYLAPRDYHGVHAPIAGRAVRTVHVGGSLYPVNARAAARIPGLYTRNERVATILQDPGGGAVAVVQVGAFNVGSVQLLYAGAPSLRRAGRGVEVHGVNPPAPIGRGEEIGRFLLGSTVVLLTSRGLLDPASLAPEGTRMRMGARLATLGGRGR